MKVYKFEDTITFLKGNYEPIYGSIIFSTDPTPDDDVIIKSDNDEIKIPLKQIYLSIFKVTLSQYGFIFKDTLYSDTNVNYWNDQIEKIACRKLKVNFNTNYLNIRWQRKTKELY